MALLDVRVSENRDTEKIFAWQEACGGEQGCDSQNCRFPHFLFCSATPESDSHFLGFVWTNHFSKHEEWKKRRHPDSHRVSMIFNVSSRLCSRMPISSWICRDLLGVCRCRFVATVINIDLEQRQHDAIAIRIPTHTRFWPTSEKLFLYRIVVYFKLITRRPVLHRTVRLVTWLHMGVYCCARVCQWN